MNVEENSPYNMRYIRILGWSALATAILTLLTAIIIHATPRYADFYSPSQGGAMQAIWSHQTGIQLEPSGQGFIGAVVATVHFVVSFYMSRRRRRREREWPSARMVNGYMGSAGFGCFWGVALMIWDIMTATATHWEGFYKGMTTKGCLYLEAVLGLLFTGICTVGLLLVCNGCECKDIGNDRRSHYHSDVAGPASSVRPDVDMNQSASWNSPNMAVRRTDRPVGTPPPVYSSKRNRQNGRTPRNHHSNPAFSQNERNSHLPQINFGPPQESQWI